MILESVQYEDSNILYEGEKYCFNAEITGNLIGVLSSSPSFKDIGMTRCFTSENNLIIETTLKGNSVVTLFENTKTIIGSQIDLILLGFNNNQPIVAKVDTGASYCSIHAEDINIAASAMGEGESVTFTYKDTKYRMPIVNKQSVQNSDGGISYRPVVKFNVAMLNKTFEDVLFNLNDRSEMTHDILLGQNLLKQSRVLVDPTLYMESLSNELTDVTLLTEKKKEEQPEHDFEQFKHLTLQEVLNTLKTFNS